MARSPVSASPSTKGYQAPEEWDGNVLPNKLWEVLGWHQCAGERKRFEILLLSVSAARNHDWCHSTTWQLSLKMVGPHKSHILPLSPNLFCVSKHLRLIKDWNMDQPWGVNTRWQRYAWYILSRTCVWFISVFLGFQMQHYPWKKCLWQIMQCQLWLSFFNVNL